MRILAWPAFKNKKEDPYNWLLYTKISKNPSIKIEDFNPYTSVLKNYDLFHIHWPETILRKKNKLIAFVKTILFCGTIFIMKIKKTKIIWTAHNISSHEQYHPMLEKILWRFLLKRIDGYISFTNSARKELEETHKELKNKKRFVIPQGDYKEIYQNKINKDFARKILHIEKDKIVILHFGKIRDYKGTLEIVKEFKKINNKKVILYIVGKIYNEKIIKEIEKDNKNIFVVNKFIPEDKVQIYFNSADLVVIPYKSVLNSGTLMLSLSFNKPLVIPKTDSFDELRRKIGEEWIYLYTDKLTSKIIEKAINSKIDKRKPNLNWCSWKRITDSTISAYKEVLNAR